MDSVMVRDTSQVFPIPPRRSVLVDQISHRSPSRDQQLDSSEEPASFHDSLYDAKVDDSLPSSPTATKYESRPYSITQSFWNNENDFLYGKGTILTPITEKRSFATIGTTGTIPGTLTACAGGAARRKKSFSTSDITLTPSTSIRMLHNQYAEPKSPIKDAIIRPSTPPGFPSWDEMQARPRDYVAPVPNRTLLRRFFPQSAVTPSPSPAIGRFRPPRSTYGTLTQHPFNINSPTPPEKLRGAQNFGTVSTQYQAPIPLAEVSHVPIYPVTLPKKLKRRCTHNNGLPLAPPPSRNSTFERLVENDSPRPETTQLMTGGICAQFPPPPVFGVSTTSMLNNQSRQPNQRCWKCTAVNAAEKAQQWWARSTNWICMTCCGTDFEVDDVAETEVAAVVTIRSGSGLGRVVSMASR